MSEQSEQPNSNPSNSSAGASPASTSLTLAVVPGWMAGNRAFGQSSPESFASFDRATCSWRTRQVSLFWGLAEFSGTWPNSGMTRSGLAYPLRSLVPLIYEPGSGSWPTPVADDTGHRRNPYSQGGKALSYVLNGPPNPRFVEWMMGFPGRVDRLRALGNALVPDIPEWIGRRIMEQQ